MKVVDAPAGRAGTAHGDPVTRHGSGPGERDHRGRRVGDREAGVGHRLRAEVAHGDGRRPGAADIARSRRGQGHGEVGPRLTHRDGRLRRVVRRQRIWHRRGHIGGHDVGADDCTPHRPGPGLRLSRGRARPSHTRARRPRRVQPAGGEPGVSPGGSWIRRVARTTCRGPWLLTVASSTLSRPTNPSAGTAVRVTPRSARGGAGCHQHDGSVVGRCRIRHRTGESRLDRVAPGRRHGRGEVEGRRGPGGQRGDITGEHSGRESAPGRGRAAGLDSCGQLDAHRQRACRRRPLVGDGCRDDGGEARVTGCRDCDQCDPDVCERLPRRLGLRVRGPARSRAGLCRRVARHRRPAGPAALRAGRRWRAPTRPATTPGRSRTRSSPLIRWPFHLLGDRSRGTAVAARSGRSTTPFPSESTSPRTTTEPRSS